MDWTLTWLTVEAIATCVLAAGIGIAIWQIIEAKRNTNARSTVDLFRELRDEKTVEKLRSSIYKIKREDLEKLPNDRKRDIDYVLDRLDTVGVLIRKNIVNQELAIEIYAGLPALRCWYILHEYIKGQRRNRGYYAENYEAFVRLSLDYFEKARIEPKFYREDESGQIIEVIDLKTKLQEKELRPRSRREIERDRKKREV